MNGTLTACEICIQITQHSLLSEYCRQPLQVNMSRVCAGHRTLQTSSGCGRYSSSARITDFAAKVSVLWALRGPWTQEATSAVPRSLLMFPETPRDEPLHHPVIKRAPYNTPLRHTCMPPAKPRAPRSCTYAERQGPHVVSLTGLISVVDPSPLRNTWPLPCDPLQPK